MNDLLSAHYNKHYKKLVSKAAGMLGDWHYGEDATQEAYENAHKYHKSYNPALGKYEPWFNSIFFNCLKKYSNFIRDKGMNMDEELVDAEDFPMGLVNKYPKTILKEIDLYTSLEARREVLVAYLLLGYRGGELEYLMGVKPHTARKTVRKFRQYLLGKYKE